MKRYTKKIKKGLYDIETSKFQNVCDYAPSSLFAVFQKLGQYEDIDEGLGISYITLVKAFACGFYYKNPNHDNRIEYLSVPEVYPIITFDRKENNYWVVLIRTPKEDHSILRFRDYGHTWALTTEELK